MQMRDKVIRKLIKLKTKIQVTFCFLDKVEEVPSPSMNIFNNTINFYNTTINNWQKKNHK